MSSYQQKQPFTPPPQPHEQQVIQPCLPPQKPPVPVTKTPGHPQVPPPGNTKVPEPGYPKVPDSVCRKDPEPCPSPVSPDPDQQKTKKN
ncbi:cornifin-A-like [Trichechus manatus latirostris]|uniref:Cornifin-A-like n=1 Tax=Trichechus manatus latirostris TaxID=127582 RepID=A0A2Y9G211_TRIMA|nr:cornifin-A-like [Trichechus manatus latirostris]